MSFHTFQGVTQKVTNWNCWKLSGEQNINKCPVYHKKSSRRPQDWRSCCSEHIVIHSLPHLLIQINHEQKWTWSSPLWSQHADGELGLLFYYLFSICFICLLFFYFSLPAFLKANFLKRILSVDFLAICVCIITTLFSLFRW